MASFTQFYSKSLAPNEGGEANNANDKGGETYRGIARNSNPNWSGWPFIDAHKPIAYNHVFPELEPQVKAFYKANYWDPILADKINSQEIAEILVDWKVNGGYSTTQLQKLLVKQGKLKASDVDGKMGRETIAAINGANQKKLWQAIHDDRLAHYNKIVANDPSQADFYDTWMRRLSSFTKPLINKRNVYIGIGVSSLLLLMFAWYKGWLNFKWLHSPRMALA